METRTSLPVSVFAKSWLSGVSCYSRSGNERRASISSFVSTRFPFSTDKQETGNEDRASALLCRAMGGSRVAIRVERAIGGSFARLPTKDRLAFPIALGDAH